MDPHMRKVDADHEGCESCDKQSERNKNSDRRKFNFRRFIQAPLVVLMMGFLAWDNLTIAIANGTGVSYIHIFFALLSALICVLAAYFVLTGAHRWTKE